MIRGDLAIAAALGKECQDILKWTGWKCIRSSPRPIQYERQEDGIRIRLAVTGMGGNRAKAGLEALLDGFHPQVLISLGYAGGLDPSLMPGDLLLGKGILLWTEERKRLTEGPQLARPSKGILDLCSSEIHCREGYLVSVDRFVEKLGLSQRLGADYLPAAVEMETYALIQALDRMGTSTSLIGLRAISDELCFEIAPFVTSWVDETFQVRSSRLLRDLLGHPGRIWLLFRLHRRSRAASKSLAKALRLIVDHLLER